MARPRHALVKVLVVALSSATIALVADTQPAAAARPVKPPHRPPVNTALPTVTGTPQAGQTLTASTGSWSNSPTSYAYRWNRCASACAIVSTSGNTLALTAADVGSTMSVTVLATNDAGPSAPATSAPTATVTGAPPPPAGVIFSVGYVDSSTGLTPWSGSANTFFIGTTAQCCSTHGPNIGTPGWEGGALLITNNTTAAVTVNSTTVDFNAGAQPSHFDLWGGGLSTTLPHTLQPGQNLVMTMTQGFNFDTSDLNGESCHLNSGSVGTAHVSINGVVTDYVDSAQILTSSGTDLASCPNSFTEEHPFTRLVPGAQPAAAPVNDLAPSTTGTPTQSRVLSAFAGAWHASPSPTLALQWLRCDSAGANCATIAGASTATYVATADDVGKTVQMRVTASNPSGTLVRTSPPTSTIQAGPALAQLGDTSTGATAVFVTGATELGSFVTAPSPGTATTFEFFARGAGNTQTFTPKVYAAANGQRGSLLATGSPISVPKATDGRWYTSTLPNVPLAGGNQYQLALASSGAFNGTYVGSELNGQMAFFVDYTAAASSGATQTLAAGEADRNLPTETVWPGAENPPYVCNWIQQGQYVTFSFSAASTATITLALRYSAGNGAASRKVELDGVVLAANLSLPWTGNWSTWSTVRLTPHLAAGAHTLKVWFDGTAGSKSYVNLDNLKVTQP